MLVARTAPIVIGIPEHAAHATFVAAVTAKLKTAAVPLEQE
jgi:hypothetical protein